jgi:hypothetical protein
MIELKSTLDGTQTEIKKDHAYLVDFSKLNSVNDLILILSAMGISFPGNHPFIEQIKPFLNLDNPFPLEQPKKPEFIKLEKI